MEQKPIPILLTDNFFLFPSCIQILNLETNENLKKVLISAWKDREGKILIVSSRRPLDTNSFSGYDSEDFFTNGSLAKIEIDLSNNANIEVVFNSLRDIQLIGLERVELLDIFKDEKENVWKGNYRVLRENLSLTNQKEIKIINELTEKFVRSLPNLLKKTNLTIIDNSPYLAISNLSSFVDYVVQNSKGLDREFKQMILEEFKLKKRLKILLDLEKKTKKIQQNIDVKINEKIVDQQKAIYLREQLEAIQNQLDKIEGVESEKENYLKILDREPFPEQVKKVVREEIKLYEKMHSQSSEANMILQHIQLLMELPWYQKSEEINDLDFAQQQLDREHFGLEKIKERIIEHLAVIQRTKNSLGSIVCLVGPPGVGKTSLASSIAKATGRNFVRMSLGGVSDEAEIRGHRRTYIGALPGKIIQEMRKAKVINPLFLIDEIDKVAYGRHGDPSSALLEALDPNQNDKFADNYLGSEVPYNLSRVLFICTANSTDLPQPLLDRMEIIYLSSYTELEKLHISKNHLIPNNLKSYGFNSEKEIFFDDEAIKEIISFYTREAGVRELNRMIQKIIRKFIVEVLQKKSKELRVDSNKVSNYLGKRIYDFTSKSASSQVGVVTGLAYNYLGGDILSIEVGCFQGKGNLLLTGKLGEVMKESASIALDYIKSNYQMFGINNELFLNNDVHIHVPEGATPKDGPSAGIALTTTIISALTGKKISSELGMTGEITLRGHVLPIGGLKEKLIAAHRSGLKSVIIPSANSKDLEEIPQEVRNQMEIIFVKNYSEVWKILTEKRFATS